ncbi:hypothetical protein NM688_g2760 [Phlebia brevispora]|uniref:Uncharacterized protein n=1 Tax=Phlebia brevispora TaxID=194682 RepID=A0ACC1T7K6_9APHY|nr:hypothetical protein NM688_g2760 [Phlebia brevispora]
MPSSDAPWDIYAEQMARMKFGIGLWYPSPPSSFKKIKIGYVGYIRRGRFRLIFDANGPIGDRVLGRDVPEGFIPLPSERTVAEEYLRPPEPLYTESNKSSGVEIQASSSLYDTYMLYYHVCLYDTHRPSAPVGGTFAYNSSSTRGALLITQDWVKCLDADRERTFQTYIKKYHASWVKFAQGKGHDVELKDIILVTGHDTTREYAMAAFANNSTTLRIEFKAGGEGLVSATASAWGSWEASPLVHRNCGPPGSVVRTNTMLPSPSSPSQESVSQLGLVDEATFEEFNQCVFIRGFHMRKRMRLVGPTVMKAAAGYDQLDRGDQDQPSSEPVLAEQGFEEQASPVSSQDLDQTALSGELSDDDEYEPSSIVPTSPFANPLEPIFDYIFERCSADFAIAHDFDVLRLAKLADVTFFEDVSALLSMVSPDVILTGDGVGRLSFDSVDSPGSSSPDGLARPRQLNERDATQDFNDTQKPEAVTRQAPVIGNAAELGTEEDISSSISAFRDMLTDLLPDPAHTTTSHVTKSESSPTSGERIEASDPSSHPDTHSALAYMSTGPAAMSTEGHELLGSTESLTNAKAPFKHNLPHRRRSLSNPSDNTPSERRSDSFITPKAGDHLSDLGGRRDGTSLPLLSSNMKKGTPSPFLEQFEYFGEDYPAQREHLEPLFTATFDDYLLHVICQHDTLLTLNITKARGNLNFEEASCTDTHEGSHWEDIRAVFVIPYEKLVSQSASRQSLVSLHFESARLLKLASPEDIGSKSDRTLRFYLQKYMDYLGQHSTAIPFEISPSDDWNVRYTMQRAFLQPEDIHADMVHFIRVRVITKYLTMQWQRAIRPLDPRDRLLNSLSEISSSWAVSTPISRHFFILFDAPEIQPHCPHSIYLRLKIEDISFVDNETGLTETFHGWQVVFAIDTLVEERSTTQIRLNVETAQFSAAKSHFDAAVASSFSNVVDFLKNDYLQVLKRMSLDVIYSTSHLEGYCPLRPPRYRKEIAHHEHDQVRLRRELEERAQTLGFDQIMAVPEDAINHMFHSLWLEGSNARTDNLLATFSGSHFFANFAAPVIRLLSNQKAVIWFVLKSGNVQVTKRNNRSHGMYNSDFATEPSQVKEDDYLLTSPCYLAFEVNLTAVDDQTLVVASKWRERFYKTDIGMHLAQNRSSYLLKHLLLDFANGEFVPQLSVTEGLGKGRDSVAILDAVLIHMRNYMGELATEGLNILYSIPVWTDRSRVSSTAFTEFRYQITTRSRVNLRNCAYDSAIDGAPVILILGSHAFHPLPQVTVPWHDGWVMRSKEDSEKTLSTVYLSQDTFLQPLLLPLLKIMNKRTTIVPKTVKMVHGQWLFDLGTFEHTVHYTDQACDWKAGDQAAHIEDRLQYVWNYSDELLRRHRSASTSADDEEAELSCTTNNTLTVPMTCRPNCLEIQLTGESTITVSGGKHGQRWSKQSSAQWSGLLKILPGPKEFSAAFTEEIKPIWTVVEDDHPFGLTELHQRYLGTTIRTSDVILAARMLQEQCKFLCPGMQKYTISSPMLRPAGGLILQVYAEKVVERVARAPSRRVTFDLPTTASTSRQTSMSKPKPSKDKSVASAVHSDHKIPPKGHTIWAPPASLIDPDVDEESHSPDKKSATPGFVTWLRTASPPPAYKSSPDPASDIERLGHQILRMVNDFRLRSNESPAHV